MKKILILMLITSLALTGCNAGGEPTEDTTPIDTIEENSIEESEDGKEVEVPAIDEFRALLLPESTSSDLALFMRDNIDKVTESEAEEMLDYLMIYQSEVITNMNNVIFDEDYLDVLNGTLDGYLNAEKIELIEDQAIREDFQRLVDSYLTIVRYEEMPVIERDWEALLQFNDNFSDELNMIVQMNVSKYEGSYTQMADKIAQIEDMYRKSDSPFLRSLWHELHKEIISVLFVGPEGLFLDEFYNKYGDVYNELLAYDNTDTEIGIFIEDITKTKYKDFDELMDLIGNYKSFGINSTFKWVATEMTAGGNPFTKYLLSSEDHDDIATKINETLEANLILIKGKIESEEYRQWMSSMYQSEDYVSVAMSIYYNANQDQVEYFDKSLTFDLSTGEVVTLEEYAGVVYEDLLEDIKEVYGVEYSSMPQFELNRDGVGLRAVEGDDVEQKYLELSRKYLLKFMPREKLYR